MPRIKSLRDRKTFVISCYPTMGQFEQVMEAAQLSGMSVAEFALSVILPKTNEILKQKENDHGFHGTGKTA